jgi:arsenate reductase
MRLKIYHYPKCSTSNTALAFLKSKFVEVEVILYSEKALQKVEILNLMQLLKFEKPLNLIKRNGLTYRNLGLAHKNLSDAEWIEEIIKNPKLLQRPIIVCDNKAVIGKNVETIADFLKLCQ